jgi:hypothetical protein
MTISGLNPTSGGNVYAGTCCGAGNEWLQIQGNPNPNSDDGMYQIQTEVDHGNITVTVPNGGGQASCSGIPSCGTLYLMTPVIGFGPPSGSNYAPWGVNSTNSFGNKIKEVQIDTQDYFGAVGIQNIYGEELSEVSDVRIVNNVSACLYVGTTNAQRTAALTGTAGVGLMHRPTRVQARPG